MEKIPELLAPAGDLRCLKAAVKAGCDAVYFGGQAFNARQGAGNLTTEEMREAIAFCSIHGVKTHLTLNTMVKQEEWPFLCSYLEETLSLGISAVIVQDLGAAALIRTMFPRTELHASTQMTVHDGEGVRFLEELGFKRVVLARELSLEEIRKIRQETSAELEVFIHGALCCSYSGRCLLSSFHGGRSGNRGTCAQPCRLPYSIDGKDEYPMNLKDLCGAGQLQKLIEAGVNSFKIEGRMKGSAYVAGVVQTYRTLLDEGKQKGQIPKLTKEQCVLLNQLFNRGEFTDGYITGRKQEMIASDSPKHQGVEVGRVEKAAGTDIILRLNTEAAPGDVLEIRSGKSPYLDIRLAAGMIRGKEIRFKTDKSIQQGQKVYRLIDIRLNEQLQGEAEKEKAVPIRMEMYLYVGKPIRLIAACRDKQICIQGPKVQSAEKRALTEEDVRRQMERLGETEFRAETIKIFMGQGCFVPISVLNHVRREAVTALKSKMMPEQQKAEDGTISPPAEGNNHELQVGVSTKEQWLALLENSVGVEVILPEFLLVDRRLTEESRKRGIRVIPQCPPVSRPKYKSVFQEAWKQWHTLGIHEFEAQHLGQVQQMKEQGDRCRAGLGLAVMNRAAAAFWQQHADTFFVSSELTGGESKEFGGLEGATILIYGRIPLMITEQCFYSQKKPCHPRGEGHMVNLEDRYGTVLVARSHCEGCYSVVYEQTPIWLGDKAWKGVHRRIELTEESREETQKLIKAVMEGKTLPDTQRGHFHKGIL